MKAKFWLLVAVLVVSVSSAPIRVGIFTGEGPGKVWTTSAHTAAPVIAIILSAPDSAGLGANLTQHPAGAVVYRFGVVTGTVGMPTEEQKQTFIEALDTLDVAVFLHNVNIGAIFSDPAHREKIDAYARSKGIVSIHKTTDSFGNWAGWDSLHGARFQNHPSSDRTATLRIDSLASGEADWRFLNRGLSDTSFLEEWFSFTTNADVIRATLGLKVLINIDESTYNGGMGGARAMGADHPMSWYRKFPEGGRFFYTAIGHRAQTYMGGTNPRFLRRQLYNAILWAAGYNEDGSRTVSVQSAGVARGFPEFARVGWSGGALRVTLLREGAHSVEIRTLEGRLVASRHGTGRVEHRFDPLPSHSMLVVTVKTNAGRATKLVAAP